MCICMCGKEKYFTVIVGKIGTTCIDIQMTHVCVAWYVVSV